MIKMDQQKLYERGQIHLQRKCNHSLSYNDTIISITDISTLQMIIYRITIQNK